MKAYRRWSARVALVVFAASMLCGIAMLPIGTGRHRETVWPLSEHFGRHHLIADIELGFGWIAVGIAALGLVGYVVFCLAEDADWL